MLRYCRLFTLPIKVNKTSALTLLLNYVRSPDHENCRMCGVNCEFKTVHTIVITDSAERDFQASNLFFAGQQHRDGNNSDQQDVRV